MNVEGCRHVMSSMGDMHAMNEVEKVLPLSELHRCAQVNHSGLNLHRPERHLLAPMLNRAPVDEANEFSWTPHHVCCAWLLFDLLLEVV